MITLSEMMAAFRESCCQRFAQAIDEVDYNSAAHLIAMIRAIDATDFDLLDDATASWQPEP